MFIVFVRGPHAKVIGAPARTQPRPPFPLALPLAPGSNQERESPSRKLEPDAAAAHGAGTHTVHLEESDANPDTRPARTEIRPSRGRLTASFAGALLATAAVAAAPSAPAAASDFKPPVSTTVTRGNAPPVPPKVVPCSTPATTVRSTTYTTYAKTVALTIDDGPSKFTPQILAVLKAKGVHATFFVTGRAARRDPATLRTIVTAGNRIGNHSDTHPLNVTGSTPKASFDKMTATAQAQQMDAASKSIAAATGARPCFFRAPGGHHWTSTTLKLSRARDMSVVNWYGDTRDWTQPANSSKTAQNSIVTLATTKVTSVHPIILLHDGKESPEAESVVSSNRSNTVAALGRVIDYYKARGFVFTDPVGRKL